MSSTVRRALDCARVLCVLSLLLPAVKCLFAQETTESTQETNAQIAKLAAETPPRTGEIPVGPGDVLHISVFQVPDLTQDVRVGATGLISLPLIPERIPVSGCTPYQLGEKLEKLLQVNGLVTHPQVSVTVKEQSSQPISVAGAVGHPVVLQQSGPTTLIEALAAAGGLSNDAGDSILIARQTPKRLVCGEADPPEDSKADPEMLHIKVSELLENGDPAYNVPVYGGDVITVPRAGIIYVAGAVGQPGGYALNDRGTTLNIMKMIALAHGLTGTAKANSAVILRKDATTGQTKQIPVKIKKIMDRKSPDMRLYAGDILYVPSSTAKRVLGVAGSAAVGISTGLAIYRIP